MRRHQVFFGQKLDGVGQRLQETVRPGPAGPDAALYVRRVLFVQSIASTRESS